MPASTFEARIIALAKQRAMIPHADLTQTHSDGSQSGDPWGPMLAELLRTGQLDQRAFQELVFELLQMPTLTHASLESDDVSPATELTFKGYESLQLEGLEHHAIAYKAWDPQLNRWVALKFPLTGSGEPNLQMLHVARIQTQVEHPNVLKVHDVGEHAGLPYVAFQHVEGDTLKAVAPRLTLEDKLQLMIQVAGALHAAHSKGLLHLHLTPSAIQVEHRKDASPWAYISAFVRPSSAAMAEVIRLHYAPFASPEQVGENASAVDFRSDIYALGVTLCALVRTSPTQAPDEDVPFDMLALPGDVDRDLACIITKCTEANPHMRYPSAQALADDLQRYLKGEPVAARKPTVPYRMKKWCLRNKALAILVAAAGVMALVAGGWTLHTRRRQAFQLQLAERFSNDVQSTEQLLRMANLARTHDRRPSVALLHQTMARIQAEMNRLGKDAWGPGSYAQGMGQAALQHWHEAHKHLDAAWAAGFRTPACAKVRGEVLTRLLLHARLTQNGASQVERNRIQERLRVQFQEPAKEAFLIARRGGLHPLYQEAMEAYLADDTDRALRLAEQAMSQTPWLYEADLLRIDILNERHTRANNHRLDMQGSAKIQQEAMVLLDKLLERAPSDPDLWARKAIWHLNAPVANSGFQHVKQAQASCLKGLEVDPDWAPCHAFLAFALRKQADEASRRGEDPMPLFDQSVEAAECSLRLRPSSQGYRILGGTVTRRARLKLERGLDPFPDLEMAAQAFGHIQTLHELTIYDHHELRGLHMGRADAARLNGQNPLPALHEALRWAEAGMKLDPAIPASELQFFFCLASVLALEVQAGLPLSKPLDATIAQLEARLASLEKSSNFSPWISLVLSRLLVIRAESPGRSEADVHRDFQAALDVMNPPVAPVQDIIIRPSYRGRHALAYTKYLLRMGQHAEPVIALGLAAVNQAIASDKGTMDNHLVRGLLLFCRAYDRRDAAGIRQAERTLQILAKKNPIYTQELAYYRRGLPSSTSPLT